MRRRIARAANSPSKELRGQGVRPVSHPAKSCCSTLAKTHASRSQRPSTCCSMGESRDLQPHALPSIQRARAECEWQPAPEARTKPQASAQTELGLHHARGPVVVCHQNRHRKCNRTTPTTNGLKCLQCKQQARQSRCRPAHKQNAVLARKESQPDQEAPTLRWF
jgi:hypothetical protein